MATAGTRHRHSLPQDRTVYVEDTNAHITCVPMCLRLRMPRCGLLGDNGKFGQGVDRRLAEC